MSVSEIFEIPKFFYFESGNDFSGSLKDFSYKIDIEQFGYEKPFSRKRISSMRTMTVKTGQSFCPFS